jgi:ABC-2 type transport system permease protein
MTVEQAIGYSTLTALFSGHRDLSVDDFPQRIREGTIVYLFLRPLSPLGYYWLQSAGAIVYRTGWVVAGGAIGVLVGLVPLPSSAAVLGLSLVSFLLAECVFVALELYIQLVAFWSVEVHGIYGVWIFTQLLLSGSLVPLWFFPSLAQRVLLVLPFASSAGTPASMYVGRIGPGAIAGAMALQAGWIAVLGAGGALLWRRAERRVVVQGG